MKNLKILFISLTIAPLVVSVAYADVGGGAGKAYFPDFSIKQKLIPPPTILEERRVISRQRVDILKAQALAIAATENTSDDPTAQENNKLRDD